MMATGSTGAYGGLEEAPESTSILAKKEPEVEGYTAKVTQLPDEEQSEYTELTDVSYVDENYEVGYYKRVLQAGDLHDDTGRCFNCNEVGHKWKECTKPQCKGLKCTY